MHYCIAEACNCLRFGGDRRLVTQGWQIAMRIMSHGYVGGEGRGEQGTLYISMAV